ncbi:MAG: heparan-alpha-glucosaminide N-acetyltransferase domain-containing protein [Candidatus Binatia bacterium]
MDLPEGLPAPKTEARLVSLDAFRGLTIAGMILVNNPGSWDHVYEPLMHAEWNGWTLADLVFPFFLFIVGVAVTFSFGDASGGRPGRETALRILRRTALLLLLGLSLNALMDSDGLWRLRIPGVLQRIALCYLAASLLYLWSGPRSQAMLFASLLIGYWLVLDLVPVAGRRPGWSDPEYNLAAYLDRYLIGESHLHRESWDPEGLLSTAPAVATTLLGVLTGHWLRSERRPEDKTAGLVVAGVVMLAAGLAFDRWMPINKNLWTSSYVLFTGGMAMVTLGFCYWLIDVRRIRQPVLPLVVFGVNPIAVYVLSTAVGEVLERVTIHGMNVRDRICRVLFVHWATPAGASLLFAACYTLLWFGASTLLYRRKIFIKI